MARFETVNELTLKVTFDGNGDYIHTKCGAMIGFQGDLKFDKELLGPGNNVVGQAVGQLLRRFTGENLPLMRTTPHSQSIGYFADNAQHVVVIDLQPGERLAVESENILAFTSSCKYGVMFLATGVMSQKGLATSTITGPGQVAITVDGNPIVLQGQCVVDPDCMVCFTGNQPTIGFDLSWKNLIPGQASGESYNMKFNDPSNVVIIQPKERTSGLDISMDGKRTGSKPTSQNNQSLGGAVNQAGNAMNQAGNMMNNLGGMMGGNGSSNSGQSGQGGIGDIIGGLFR